MTRKQSFDSNTDGMLEREIEGLLKVDPPADFLPRLHARIQLEPLPSAWTPQKLYLAGTAALALAAVLALAIFNFHETKWDNTPGVPAPISADLAAPKTRAVVMSPEPSIPDRAKLPARIRRPELMISADETRAIRRLLEGQMGPLPANLANSLAMPEVTGELVIPQIAIQPVEVPRPITIEPMSMPPAITEEGV